MYSRRNTAPMELRFDCFGCGHFKLYMHAAQTSAHTYVHINLS